MSHFYKNVAFLQLLQLVQKHPPMTLRAKPRMRIAVLSAVRLPKSWKRLNVELVFKTVCKAAGVNSGEGNATPNVRFTTTNPLGALSAVDMTSRPRAGRISKTKHITNR